MKEILTQCIVSEFLLNPISLSEPPRFKAGVRLSVSSQYYQKDVIKLSSSVIDISANISKGLFINDVITFGGY